MENAVTTIQWDVITSNITQLLGVGLDALTKLIANPYVLLFFSFSVLMFGFHIIRSARSMF